MDRINMRSQAAHEPTRAEGQEGPSAPNGPTGIPVLHRCDQFVGRTTNWLYDHLRCLPRYRPLVLCEALVNRDEFPELEAWKLERHRLSRRLWRRLADERPYPTDWWRLQQIAPRLLHSHFGGVAAEDVPLWKALAVPWVVAFYGADVYQSGRLPEWREQYARVFEKCARVLALGPVMKSHLEKLGCSAQKVTVHALGVDVDHLPNKPRVLRRGDVIRLLFAGTLREKKGIPYVIEAASLAHRAGIPLELHLVGDAAGKSGDAETKQALIRQISALGVENLVVWHGYLPFADLIRLSLEAHVFVAPSVTAADGDAEGTPFVLQQMMATDMPAIATVHSDIPFLFGPHTDLLVPERNARAIAERIQQYAEEPETMVRDGALLGDQMRRAFRVQDCAGRLAGLYDELLGQRTPR